MFFQALTTIFIVILFCWLIWRLIVKPILEGHGVKVDDDPVVKTDHTKRLDKTRQAHAKAKASVNAVKEERDLIEDIAAMNREIKYEDEKIQEKK